MHGLKRIEIADMVDSDIRIESHWDPEKKSAMVVWWKYASWQQNPQKIGVSNFWKAPRDSTTRYRKSYVNLQGCWQLLPHARGLDWISHLTGLVVKMGCLLLDGFPQVPMNLWIHRVIADVQKLAGSRSFHELYQIRTKETTFEVW